MSQSSLDRLTRRQRDVLDLLAKGLTNEEIGSVLGIGAATVKTHVSAILSALGVENRTEAAWLLNQDDPALAPEFDDRPAIAVLAFDAQGWDGEAGATFVRGLVDDLVELFCRWRWFPVIARLSSLELRHDGTEGVAAAARQLRARYLLHGNARRDDRRIRLTVFLDDAEQGLCVWSEHFEARGEALFDLQEQLANDVVAAVYPRLVSSEIWRARRARAKTLSAWTLTHQGLWHVDRRSPADNASAHELLDRALLIDDVFVPALFAKGLALFQDLLNQWSQASDVSRERLQRVADSAVALLPEAPLGYLLRARAAMSHGDMLGAARHVEIATAINPSYAEGHALLGQLLATSGKHEEGLSRMRRAHRLSPRAYVAGLAIALFSAGHYAEALTSAEEVLASHPHYLFPRLIAAGTRVLLGDLPEAHGHVAALRASYPDFRTSQLSRLYREKGFETGDRLFAALHRVGVPA